MKRLKLGLLSQIIIAVILGVICGELFPTLLARLVATFNSLFSNFLGFSIPLIILGLVAPSIAELGKGAGRLLGATVGIAYGSTVVAGLFSYFVCKLIYPLILTPDNTLLKLEEIASAKITPFFSVSMPPIIDTTSTLILAFVIGMGLSSIKGTRLKEAIVDFKDIVTIVITKVIIPLLPLYIFGIFLIIGSEGKLFTMLSLFIRVIGLIFVMHIILLVVQFIISGAIRGKNPFKALYNMLPAYATALGTQSSAATIPVTLEQCKKNGVSSDIAEFVVPLCATIHLSGSILKIVACAFAIMWMQEIPCSFNLFIGFIFMLGITMVAAPGIPGGAIMAALGPIASILGFDESSQALMIALYITMDSFGTAGNVTGDGAIAMIIDKIYRQRSDKSRTETAQS